MKKILILIIVMLVSSCKKKGCIDRLANNYDSSAKKESTCYYTGRAVLWTNKNDNLKFQHQLLDYYVNGTFITSDSLQYEKDVEPVCEDSNAESFEQDLGTNSTGTMYFRIVVHQTGKVVCDSSAQVFGGYCISRKINLK